MGFDAVLLAAVAFMAGLVIGAGRRERPQHPPAARPTNSEACNRLREWERALVEEESRQRNNRIFVATIVRKGGRPQ